ASHSPLAEASCPELPAGALRSVNAREHENGDLPGGLLLILGKNRHLCSLAVERPLARSASRHRCPDPKAFTSQCALCLPVGRGSRTHCLLLREDEVLFHLRPHLTQVGKVLAEAAVVVAVLPAIGLALEVVVARCAVLVAGGLAAVLDDFLHPPLLGLCGAFDGLVA